ncbi:MAG: prolipoprotein diacylglyceryl transferase [Alphaproteobacteria bacterium]|nr:prolipoprotein diacylglyceryl transferase [Alphaproteobacteria bacterium]
MTLNLDAKARLTGAIQLPEFNVFAIQFGDFGIRWYALSYIAGLLIGIFIIKRAARAAGSPLVPDDADRLLNYILIGIILGGRLGYALFYNTAYYLANPMAIIRIWEGGMSFHGALIGVALALIVMARKHHIPLLAISDRVAMVTPIGLFLGRLANFINGELYGRVTDVPWAMIFPNSDGQPRHPSQLYEAGLEGLVLGLVLFWVWRRGGLGRRGLMTGTFVFGYGCARFLVELVREPDAHLGLFAGGVSMGQILTIPMVLGGLYLLRVSRRPD